MSDALERVKADLGRDAIILHTRTLRTGGVLGVGAKEVVEITATRDVHVDGGGQRAPAMATHASPLSRTLVDGRTLNAAYSTTVAKRPSGGPVPGASLHGGAVADRSPSTAASREIGAAIDLRKLDGGLRAEVGAIRDMVAQILREAQTAQAPALPAELIEYYTGLVGQDVSAEIARQLLERIAGKLGLGAGVTGVSRSGIIRTSDERIRAELTVCVGEMLPAAAPIQLTARNRPTVVALVGPTGVGKTTTIAKLAAVMKLREKRRVGMITIDTYRIAAVEQLRTYAQILDVPLISVMTPGEMKTAIGRMADRDLILLDTAGRSQRDDARIDELQRFLRAAEPDQIHLVLSTTSREEMIREAVERFAAVGASHLVFTKLDEAVGLGVMLNVLHTVNLKLSYLTSGQSVPDDIENGSAKRVAELIVAGMRSGGGATPNSSSSAGERAHVASPQARASAGRAVPGSGR